MTATSIIITQTILDALRPNQSLDDWLARVNQQKLDWEKIAVTAIILGLAPQLHARLTAASLRLPPRPAAKLAVTHQAQAQRNAAIYHQLNELLNAAANKNLQPIILKGAHLAADYYAEPALRPMNDIDILFPPHQLAAAEALLTDLGYEGHYKSPDMGAGVLKHTSTFRRPNGRQGETVNPYLSANQDRTIEPHTSLEESWFGLHADITPGIRQRAIPATLGAATLGAATLGAATLGAATLGDQTALVLAPEDLLLHVAIHFCFHLIQGAPAMVQLTDILTVSASGRVDWSLLTERATHYRVAPYTLAGLRLAYQILDAPIPPNILDQLAQTTPTPLRQRIEALTLTSILSRTQQPPLTTLSQRLNRGFQDRAETARWALDWPSRLNVWRTLLQFNRTDTAQLIRQQLLSSNSNNKPST